MEIKLKGTYRVVHEKGRFGGNKYYPQELYGNENYSRWCPILCEGVLTVDYFKDLPSAVGYIVKYDLEESLEDERRVNSVVWGGVPQDDS